jgi:hypothetical protein
VNPNQQSRFESTRFFIKRERGYWNVMDRALPERYVLHATSKEIAFYVALVLNSLDQNGEFQLPHKDWPPQLKVAKKAKAS